MVEFGWAYPSSEVTLPPRFYPGRTGVWPLKEDQTMKRKRFTEEQIIRVLREHELGAKTADLCPKHGISEAPFYNWKSRLGGLDVAEARRLKQLEGENVRLKKLLADSMLDNAALKDLLSKNGDAP